MNLNDYSAEDFNLNTFLEGKFTAYDHQTAKTILSNNLAQNATVPPKQLFLCVGAPGTGKSTYVANLYSLGVLTVPFVSEEQLSLHCSEPRVLACPALATTAYAKHMFSKGASFCLETSFGDPSLMDAIITAKKSGYKLSVFYVHTSAPEVTAQRLLARSRQGGPAPSLDKVSECHTKAKDYVIKLIEHCDNMLFFDNSKDLTQTNLQPKNIQKVEEGQCLQ